jgi:hypothetical protein
MRSRYYRPPTYSDIFPLREPETDDIRVAVSQSQVDLAQGPQWTTYKGGYVLEFITGQDKTIKFNVQLPHGWQDGSILRPHIHWVGANTNSGNVKWEFTYSWANVDAAFPTETALTMVLANETVLADKHRMDFWSNITGTGKTYSSMLICSVSRLGNDGQDTYSGSAYLTEFDMHIDKDTLGEDV